MPVLRPLNSVIECLSTGSITVTRRQGTGYDDNGRPVRGTDFDLVVDPAVVNPARGDELQQLPEGERVIETISVITKDQLFTATVDGDEADRVCYDGKTFKVVVSENWDKQSGHWRALAQREQV